MIICIIAGGSGTRLWPLSTPNFPKQLLKVNGDKRSLIQRTYDRAALVTDKIYVVSEISHIDHVKEQLNEVPVERLIIEPGRRGTANCIVQAIVHIKRFEDSEEPIIFIHSDHYIRDVNGFAYSFEKVSKLIKRHNQIVLVGVEPDYPSTAFGYIQRGDEFENEELLHNVVKFKEKPDYDTAKEYFKSGNYLWNCGYFAGTINTFIESMNKYAPDLYQSYKKLDSTKEEEFDSAYLSLESDAIDYALIEKLPNLAVFSATFDWMDLGSFRDLAAANSGDDKGNISSGNIYTDEVTNSYIDNKEPKPLAVIGLDNVVVVNTKDGILVARIDLSQKVGEISKKIYEDMK